MKDNVQGYFGIGIYSPQKSHNVGTLWRSAFIFGASFIFTIGGQKYHTQSSDTTHAPKYIPLYHYLNMEDFYLYLPKDCLLVGVEISSSSQDLRNFTHPERAIYLLGSETTGLPERLLEKCHRKIQIPTYFPYPLNVSMAGNIIMYDRLTKESNNFKGVL